MKQKSRKKKAVNYSPDLQHIIDYEEEEEE